MSKEHRMHPVSDFRHGVPGFPHPADGTDGGIGHLEPLVWIKLLERSSATVRG